MRKASAGQCSKFSWRKIREHKGTIIFSFSFLLFLKGSSLAYSDLDAVFFKQAWFNSDRSLFVCLCVFFSSYTIKITQRLCSTRKEASIVDTPPSSAPLKVVYINTEEYKILGVGQRQTILPPPKKGTSGKLCFTRTDACHSQIA